MRVTQRIIAGALFAAVGAGAWAQDSHPDLIGPETGGSMTRDQVKAELAQAREDGTINAWTSGYNFITPGTKTRAQVRAELDQAVASGEYELRHSEAYDPFRSVPRQPTYAQRGQ